ncbi:nucleotide-binding oligomerization domain-containing protein 1 isoform X1 [Myiozetetes cayanensis]|uniref:nucleotide-binding oligomerization domain-containing protein 1 isoform X1 n=1 Tax=Myiozetetes cayanensis TaxID=478635 RepID=UPI00215F1B03|nr:nucleotide-binding oligomerization domain-containing protein 1 isoform X1 [Myiozetetes cayanensis]XP_050173689.1 nucleotide-binding oligomerization domain-containing protein 1 isoform X1 [Myiozetetes cayanensis]XP_050173698.1 nucleotide-binding oligomerization domain-containing protein 1 isoform X1 [Myiozetetes cayanensis]XP_050173706.1 nucleotide-binding oligomerization domain-containing protein 1 isoform X1 [Myiozetetes cayanensis]XP_050173714.1 nucleotide-binding oligomerization domain-co
MEGQLGANRDISVKKPPGASPPSFIALLKVHRELLVSRIRNTQCLIDNLIKNEYFSTEDAEIVVQFPTQADKVRKILDLVQSKGEEVSEYFIYVLQKVTDAYYELQPWLDEIGYEPSENICRKPVVNTDPVSRYCQKLRYELGRDSKFVMSYTQREEMLLEEIYSNSIMELVSFTNESLGHVGQLEALFDDTVGLINEDGETVYVYGDAGIGKSILLQKIQSLWAKKKLDIGAKFFFRFPCRMFSCFKEDKAICLKDLLFKYNCYPDQDPTEVFHHILQFPHTVLFTFDGFDEIYSNFDLSSVPEICSPHEPIHPLALLVSLLRGKLLKGSRKILTARTGTEIQRNIIKKKVLLRGFSSSNLREYTVMFFRDEQQRTLVLNQLESNPNLCSLCSVPLFCWIIFKCYEHFYSMFDSHELPDSSVTLTDVFLLLIEVHLNRSLKTGLLKNNIRSQAEMFKSRKETLLALGKMAYKGMENSFFIFEQEEVSSANISEEDLQLGFLRTVKGYSGCDSQATYEFLHSTLQSFFTALFLVIEEKVGTKELLEFFNECSFTETAQPTCLRIPWLKKQLAGENPFQNKEHFNFTNMFLCGLLSGSKQKLFRHLVSPAVLKRKRKTLITYLGESMKSHLKGYTRSRLKSYNQIQVQPNFVWMLRCLYETQSEKVGKLAAKRMHANYIKLAYCNAYSADCSAISFVLHHFRKRLALDLDNNNINDYGIKQLLPSFSKLAVIRLSVNQVTDHGVRILYEELSKYRIVSFLGLYSNQITDVGAKYVAKLIEECSSLEYVKYVGSFFPFSRIGANKITSEGGKCLAQAIQKSKTMFEIGMWGNQVGDEGAKAFAEALRNHPRLTNVSLAFNGITTEGGKSIAEAMQHNNSVRIFWLTKNELDDEAAMSFAEMLKVNKKLVHLWLIQNQITAKGVKYLSEALKENTTIKEICLNGNLISQEESKAFENEERIICF